MRLRFPRVAMRAFQPTFFDAAGEWRERECGNWTPHDRGVLTLLVHGNSGLDLLKLVEDEGVGLVAVGMVVREGVKRLGLLALADEETGGFGDEPDEEELEDGGDGLKDGRNAPCPLAVDPRRAERGPRSTVKRKLFRSADVRMVRR